MTNLRFVLLASHLVENDRVNGFKFLELMNAAP
jgi:hypothetical protein